MMLVRDPAPKPAPVCPDARGTPCRRPTRGRGPAGRKAELLCASLVPVTFLNASCRVSTLPERCPPDRRSARGRMLTSTGTSVENAGAGSTVSSNTTFPSAPTTSTQQVSWWIPSPPIVADCSPSEWRDRDDAEREREHLPLGHRWRPATFGRMPSFWAISDDLVDADAGRPTH